MVPRSWITLSLMALAQTVQSAVVDLPTPTNPGIHQERADINGFSPKPTGEAAQQIFKRAIALARTCGWDRSSSVVSCGVGETCAYFSTIGTRLQACCSSGYSNCDFATTCVPYSIASGTRSSTRDPLAVSCTNSATPYCVASYFASNGVTGYGCEATSTSTKYIYSTYSASGASTVTTAYLSLAPRSALPAALTSSTRTSTSAYATYTSRTTSSSSSSRYRSSSAGISTAAIIILVVIIILWALYYVGACVIIFFMCRRSKRAVADWKTKGMTGPNGVAGHPYGISVAPYYGPTNVMSPPAPVYQHQNGMVPAAGDHSSGYYGPSENKVSPTQAGTYPAPTPSPGPAYQSHPPSQIFQQPGQQPSPPASQMAQPAPVAAGAQVSGQAPLSELSASQSPAPVQPSQLPPPQTTAPAPSQRPQGSNTLHEIG